MCHTIHNANSLQFAELLHECAPCRTFYYPLFIIRWKSTGRCMPFVMQLIR